MVEEFVRATNVLQAGKADLRDDGTELATRCRDTVCRGPVTSREDFSRNNECSNIRPEILEEVRNAVKGDEPVALDQRIIGET